MSGHRRAHCQRRSRAHHSTGGCVCAAESARQGSDRVGRAAPDGRALRRRDAAGLLGAVLCGAQTCRRALPPRDYVAARIMSPRYAEALALSVRTRRNILVVGGTSSGKTTLVNALLAEVADLNERVVILEDTRELKCTAPDCVCLRTKPGVATLADLVRSTLRLRPDRIIVGEVRGPEGGTSGRMVRDRRRGRRHPGGDQAARTRCAGPRSPCPKSCIGLRDISGSLGREEHMPRSSDHQNYMAPLN